MSLFNKSQSIFEITEKYPQTIDVFVLHGFTKMKDEGKRRTLGKKIKLSTALMLKNLDFEGFTALLEQAVNNETGLMAQGTSGEEKSRKELHITGLLPCPVRLPLIEKFEEFVQNYQAESGHSLSWELQAASMGLSWLEENRKIFEDEELMPDLFISAGFDLFFDKAKIGQFRSSGVFADLSGFKEGNKIFKGVSLLDPKGVYSMISAVPAVFLVNPNVLDGRPAPRSWKDLVSGGYEKSISLPIGDFDLFNAILLNIHKAYGPGGISGLGRALLEGMHPSEMVKSGSRKGNKPGISIVPYFFTKIVRPSDSMQVIWPEDGAILSPVFLLAKKKKEKVLKPLVDFFASREVGEILAHRGLFPAVNPEVDNLMDETGSFMWLGWDYIAEHDIAALIRDCQALFDQSRDRA